jgi:hypothetical protein
VPRRLEPLHFAARREGAAPLPTLEKHERFFWTIEVMLARTPILTPPQDGEPLYLYVAATTQVVSAVIVVERTEEGHALLVQ